VVDLTGMGKGGW